MSTDSRKYQLKARAERQQETRRRIVAATSDLHREVGPARTTVTDIARRAGVQRLTVYNNFPEPSALLAACQGHFLASNPPPDISPGVPKDRALTRLEQALRELYEWFRSNEAMERNVHRDRRLVAELDELMRANADVVFDRAAREYAQLIGRTPAAVSQVRRLVRLALEFASWELLAGDGLSDREVARLFRRAIAAIA